MLSELQTQSQQWRAIEIFEGPQAIDQTGYIARFSEPLARQHVDLIYVSTYNTDLILVMDDAVERAVTSLQQISLAHLSRPASPTPIATTSTPKFTLQDDLEAIEGDASETHILAKLPNKLSLLSFDASQVPDLTHSLLQLFLFPQNPSRFFSYTSYGGQVTLILDDLDYACMSRHYLNLKLNEHTWNAIHIQASAQGIDSGVVNFAAKLLAENQIPIYYLATLHDDFILVPEISTNDALACLQGIKASSTGSQTPSS